MSERRVKVTMADIARESGVSLSTVSLVLNDKPGLPNETRKRVLHTARTLGYALRPSTPAITKPATLQTVGMLVKRSQGDIAPPSSNIFFSHVIAGIEAGCRQENISLLYSTLPVDENSHTLDIPRLIHDSKVDGLIFVGNYIDDRLHAAIQQRTIPVVLVEAYCSIGEYDAILIDNRQGAYQAVEHLLKKGHRHIAFVGSFPDSRISFRYRRAGYQQALLDHGITQVYYGDCPHNQRDAIISVTCRLIRENPQITAIFGCSDEVSVIAVHGVLEAGKRVPEDISMVGFDDNTIAENALPPLTTIHVDKMGMGRMAIPLLVNRAEAMTQGIVTVVLHTTLVERRSVRELS